VSGDVDPDVPSCVRLHICHSDGRAAWLFDQHGVTWIEHCLDGHWHTCRLYGTDRQWRLGLGHVVCAHLDRKTGHGDPVHGQLVGTHHAGGGLLPYMKGPPTCLT
jgi:hypothetical protein